MTVQPERRGRIAKIHIAKKMLALEDDSYRALLVRVAGKDSSALCTDAQLDLVLAEFARLGFVAEPAKARPRSDKAYVRMIYAIWGDLKPYLKDSSQRALQTFVRRQAEVDAPEFLSPEDAYLVIEGLKAWLERERAKAPKARGGKTPVTRMRRKPAGTPPTRQGAK
jgi:hypothetical protein